MFLFLMEFTKYAWIVLIIAMDLILELSTVPDTAINLKLNIVCVYVIVDWYFLKDFFVRAHRKTELTCFSLFATVTFQFLFQTDR